MTIAKWLVITLITGLALWTVGSWFTVAGIEEAKYTVLESADGYEIRRYEPALIAETAMPTLSRADTGTAFRAIAGYIFGGNEAVQSIAMTAPVVMGTGTMAFVMPSKYKTIADLPKPTDGRVVLRAIPSRTVAALRFSWYASEERVGAKSAQLLELLKRDGRKVLGPPVLASYDPPFSMPMLKRHDILVEVEAR